MRLKSSDGPLSVHSNNGNPDILNSPKRINTLQNSNITSNITTTTQDVIISDDRTLNNINTEDRRVQWCNTPHLQQRNNREILTNNANNRLQRYNNINNTLDTRLTDLRRETASSVCSESSPDDSLLDYEGKKTLLKADMVFLLFLLSNSLFLINTPRLRLWKMF